MFGIFVSVLRAIFFTPLKGGYLVFPWVRPHALLLAGWRGTTGSVKPHLEGGDHLVLDLVISVATRQFVKAASRHSRYPRHNRSRAA